MNQVIHGLKSQTFPFDQWEYLLVDNGSDIPLASEFDLTWHPNAKHIVEPILGLTKARRTGIKATNAEIVVFVDDDNILDPDYLKNVVEISIQYPNIGAWGGQIHPEFETPPEPWATPYLWMLALRSLKTDRWSNIPYCYESAPCGAGLCARRLVVEKYALLLDTDKKRQNLGRRGETLTSCEDVDLACTACDIGLGTGVFTRLNLTHIIPAKRLQQNYLLQLAEANGYSTVIVESLRGKLPTPASSFGKFFEKIRQTFKMTPIDRRFSQAFERGRNRALQEVGMIDKIEQ